MKERHIFRNVFDIPKIQEYLEHEFSFVLYDVGDNLSIYQLEKPTSIITLEVHSNETLIKNKDKLIDLITQDELVYLMYSERENEGDLLYIYEYIIPYEE